MNKRELLFQHLTPGLNDELSNWYIKLVRQPHKNLIDLRSWYLRYKNRDNLPLLRF